MSMRSLQGWCTPGSRDECRTAPDGRRPLDQSQGSYETTFTGIVVGKEFHTLIILHAKKFLRTVLAHLALYSL